MSKARSTAKVRTIVAGALLCGAALGHAASPSLMENVGAILEASTGRYSGELYYLDYQSGERFAIPMTAATDISGDGRTLIRKLTFTDPGNLVHAVSVTTLDAATGELVEAYFRDGSVELMRAIVTRAEFDSARAWRLEYEHEGVDDGRPARIRHTTIREGDSIESTKSVRFIDAAEQAFFLRNGSTLKLIRD